MPSSHDPFAITAKDIVQKMQEHGVFINAMPKVSKVLATKVLATCTGICRAEIDLNLEILEQQGFSAYVEHIR